MNDEKTNSTLGELSKGKPDHRLGERPEGEHQAKPIQPHPEQLDLPKGALLAYRKSGGLKFSSREIVVYPDGRISIGGPDVSKQAYARAARKLNDGQVMRLRKLLDQVSFFRTESAQGDQPPDSYAHEIIARLGSRTNYVQVFDGGIPSPLLPLIQQLSTLMPKE